MLKKLRQTMLKGVLALAFTIAMLFGSGNNTALAADLDTPGFYYVPVVDLVSKAPLEPVKTAFANAFGDKILVEVSENGSKMAWIDLQHMIVDMGEMGAYHCNILSMDGAIITATEPRKLTPNLGMPDKVSNIEAPIQVKVPLELDEKNQQVFTITVDFMDYLLGGGMPYPTDVTLTVDLSGVTPAPEQADYSKVDELLATIPEDLSIYTDESVATLQTALDKIGEKNKSITEQPAVNKLAKEIEAAITGLEIQLADYSKVDEAVATVPEDLSIYTDESVEALQTLLDQIGEKNLPIAEQAKVDQLARDIDAAVQALVVKPADYSKVDEALAKVPEDLSIYTTKSIETLNAAVEKVGKKDKLITEQAKVDQLAEELETAIAGLEIQPADYSKVDEAFAKVPEDLSAYTNESVEALQAVLDQVGEKNLPITEQEKVDQLAKDLEAAIAGLEVKPVTGSWQSNSTGWWYLYSDGTYLQSTFKEIDGKTYYFGANGYMLTGWQYIEGSWYWFENSGAMYANGWKWIDGSCYYFFENGKMAANTEIDGSYVNASGAWVQDKWVYNEWGWWYSYAKGGYPKSTFEKINGKTYYFDEYGYIKTGWQWIEGAWYYFDASGAMYANGWQWIDGNSYYFYKDGKMAANEEIDGYYVNVSGAWVQDKWVYNEWGWWYSYAKGGYPKSTFETINGKTYYFDEYGYIKTGWQWINGECYYFHEDGVMASDETIDGFYVNQSGVWVA